MIQFQSVSKHYEKHTALNNVSFTIDKGKIFGLLGPNGAGKTTLLRLLTRMLLPDEGSISFNEQPLSESILPKIGYLPEERGLYPKMYADEHIHFLSSLKGLKTSDSKQRLIYWAKELAIEDLLRRKIENLSKGQQQKIQLISCLIHDPEIVILDEPFSGFDPINAELLKHILFKLREQGKHVIISTHRMDNAEELCDDLAMLYNGRLVLIGSLKQILNSESSRKFLVTTSEEIKDGLTFKILNHNHLDFTLELAEGCTSNEVLQELIGKCIVHSFSPENRSLKEVFLEKAK